MASALLAVLAAAAPAPAREPTRAHPIVVGERAVALRDLERVARSLLPVLVDPEIARGQAAGQLIDRAWRRAEAARRGLRSSSELAVAKGVAAGTRDPLALARRFEAYDRRWSAVTRCTPRWSLGPPCVATPLPCVWAGASDVCTVAEPPDPAERPYWSVQLVPADFGLYEDGVDLTRRIAKRIAAVPGLRRRLGEILNEGEVSIFALSRRDAWLVAREAMALRAALAR